MGETHNVEVLMKQMEKHGKTLVDRLAAKIFGAILNSSGGILIDGIDSGAFTVRSPEEELSLDSELITTPIGVSKMIRVLAGRATIEIIEKLDSMASVETETETDAEDSSS